MLLSATGDAKIADIGLARVAGGTYVRRSDGVIGTLSHAAPELILGLKCSDRADVYSLGVTLWEVATKERAARGQLRDVRPGEVPSAVASLIRACLDPDPRGRPSAREAYEILAGGDGGARPAAGGGPLLGGVDAVAVAELTADGPPPPPARQQHPPPPPLSTATSDGDPPPATPFAAACRSPFASERRDEGGGGGGAAQAAEALAAAARAALALGRRRR